MRTLSKELLNKTIHQFFFDIISRQYEMLSALGYLEADRYTNFIEHLNNVNTWSSGFKGYHQGEGETRPESGGGIR